MNSEFVKKADNGVIISVGMPVYNGEKFIAESIQSILNQTLTEFELIISDNASSDRTEEICRAFVDKDPRIRYYRNAENIGAARNYKRLLDLARGEYFRWSNSDDLIAPQLHASCLDALESNAEAVLSYGKTKLIDERGATIKFYEDNLHLTQRLASERLPRYFEQVGLTNVIYGLMRTSAVRQTSVFGDGSLPGADISFMAELVMLGTFIEVPDVMFFRRMHEGASTADREDSNRKQAFWRGESIPFTLPTLRQCFRYLRRIWKIDELIAEKLRLSAYILRRLIWQRSRVVSELIAALRWD
jgi:glycosyltransferase involved in cell wall biosynthesis